jgi:glycosyltransferase involved in cell wall biosynthesis
VGEREIVALHPADEPGPYPPEVRRRIRLDIRDDYSAAAMALNDRGVDVVSLQHDFAIWGGDEGAYVLDFTRALRLPLVTTLHTVPAAPTPAQLAIVRELIDTADMSVVMSEAARARVAKLYGRSGDAVRSIPYGIVDLPFVDAESIKPRLGMQGRTVLLTHGLLHRQKGYEAVIESMPAIVKAVPNAFYVILGATRPDTVAREGETYRDDLQKLADSLGIGDRIKFVDRFVGRVDLATWLEAADIIVTPYRDLGRTVSGSLAYAMGAGRAVVSTPFAYASEMLAEGRGTLVSLDSDGALADALIELASDPGLRADMGRRGYEHTRRMVWSEVGSQYRDAFGRALHSHGAERHVSQGHTDPARVA